MRRRAAAPLPATLQGRSDPHDCRLLDFGVECDERQRLHDRCTGQQLIEAGCIIFLIMTVVLTLLVVFGIFDAGASTIIVCLLCCTPFLLVRIIFSVVGAFNFAWSLADYDADLGHTLGPYMCPEFVAVCILQGIGLYLLRQVRLARIDPNASLPNRRGPVLVINTPYREQQYNMHGMNSYKQPQSQTTYQGYQ